MDVKDIESDLHALQKLYGLLKDHDGVSSLPYAMPDTVDDKARHMLKNLLDVETRRVFKAHSEIFGSCAGESLSSQQHQHIDTVNHKFPVQAKPENALVKSYREDINTMKEEHRLSNLYSEAAMNRLNMSAPENYKKRCRICQRSTIKPLQNLKQHQMINQDTPYFQNWSNEIDKGLILNNMEKRIQVGDDYKSYNPSNAGSTSCEVQSGVVPKCGSEGDSLSNEASEAIREIESRILSLQIDSENSGPPRKRVDHHEYGYIERDALDNSLFFQEMNQSNHQLKNSNRIKWPKPNPSPLNHHMASQNAGFTSLRDALSVVKKPQYQSSQNVRKKTVPNNRMCYVNKKRFDPTKMSDFSSQMNKEIEDENQVDWNERIGEFMSVDTAHKVNSTKMRSDTRLDQPQVRVKKSNKHIKPMRKVVMDDEESGSIISGSDSDSESSTNQEISSTSYNGSEEYSVSGENQSESSSESEALPRRIQDRYVGPTSSSENEIYSSASATNETPISSYETESQNDSAIRTKDDVNRKTIKNKQSGRLKKLKDKLAIIFHHHHHHHHHVHQGGDDDEDDDNHIIKQAETKTSHGKKITHTKRENEMYVEQAVEKIGKSVISGPKKNQHRHFHELVKGVLRHKHHSSKEKKNKHGEDKKKSHWWKLLQNHKGAKKAHPKLPFPNKKTKSKKFPKLK